MTYAIAEPSAPADAKRESRKPSIHTLKLKDRGSGRKGLAKQDTDRFSAVVLTWNDPEAQAKGTPEVRSRDIETGKWSGWQKVAVEPSQADGAEGAQAALRGRHGVGVDRRVRRHRGAPRERRRHRSGRSADRYGRQVAGPGHGSGGRPVGRPATGGVLGGDHGADRNHGTGDDRTSGHDRASRHDRTSGAH
ncbi:hypothetical protein SSP24_55390 [Streptomyces spinoverrucosus]|uniref:Uncharacterized protein n=1 Tax=Streptomyces spinoverrucosus TaxID=284043 RepID=A0A4Y3VLU3_9ACTN|nr:hypothetical protein SSP24_55390 [Streptomyces spinoverrucosus]